MVNLSPEQKHRMSKFYHEKCDQSVDEQDIIATMNRMFGDQITAVWLLNLKEEVVISPIAYE